MLYMHLPTALVQSQSDIATCIRYPAHAMAHQWVRSVHICIVVHEGLQPSATVIISDIIPAVFIMYEFTTVQALHQPQVCCGALDKVDNKQRQRCMCLSCVPVAKSTKLAPEVY